jgi:hypothetical protein
VASCSTLAQTWAGVATPVPAARLAGRAVPRPWWVVQPRIRRGLARIWRLHGASGLLRSGGYLWPGGGVGSHGGGLWRGGGLMADFCLAVGGFRRLLVQGGGARGLESSRHPAGDAGWRACRRSVASLAVRAGPPCMLRSGRLRVVWLRLFWWPCRPLRARVGRPPMHLCWLALPWQWGQGMAGVSRSAVVVLQEASGLLFGGFAEA